MLTSEEKELFEAIKNLFVQVHSHQFQIAALLRASERDSLFRAREILDEQAASDEFQGLVAEALQDAQQVVSLFCDKDYPLDPTTLIHLVPGGKEE